MRSPLLVIQNKQTAHRIDSLIVLHSIQYNGAYKRFVASRVRRIQEHYDISNLESSNVTFNGGKTQKKWPARAEVKASQESDSERRKI